MFTRLPGLIVVLGMALCIGCTTPHHVPPPTMAQVPVPTAYPLTTQQKMQAVHHWDVLAGDVADRIHAALDRRVVERQFPVYVAPSGATPFAKSFHALLITRLVEKNVAVSNTHEHALILSFDINVVRHSQRVARSCTGLYKALAPDVYVQRHTLGSLDPMVALGNEIMLQAAEHNVDAGMYTTCPPRVEALITTTLLSGDDFLMRDSSIYYINDADWWHYRQHATPRSPGVVNFQLVDR